MQEVCSNCGAAFAGEEARCPYCGAINPSGAERAYMNGLENLRDATDQLDDNVRNSLKSDLQRNAVLVVRVVVVVVVMIAALLIAARILEW